MKVFQGIFGTPKKKEVPTSTTPRGERQPNDGSFTSRAIRFLSGQGTTRNRSHTIDLDKPRPTIDLDKPRPTVGKKDDPIDTKLNLEVLKKGPSVKLIDKLEPNSARGFLSARKTKSNIQTFSINTSREQSGHGDDSKKDSIRELFQPDSKILKEGLNRQPSKKNIIESSRPLTARKKEPVETTPETKREKRKSIFQALIEKAIGQQGTIQTELDKMEPEEFEDGDDPEKRKSLDYSQDSGIVQSDDPISNLHRAALVGDLQKLKKLLKSKDAQEIINSTDRDGSFPLHKAASKNKFQAIKLLLDAGAKVDVFDKVQSTPLHWACANTHLESVQMLCKYNAQVNIRDKYGYSPLHLCLRKKGYKCADFLLLMGADINYKREDGATSLHVSCEKGDFTTVQYLCGKPKIIVNRRDKFGDTPVMMAAAKGHLKIVEFLMKKDIQSCRIRNEKNENLLHQACTEGHKQVVFMVANLSPIICSSLMNEQDIYGRTPLHHAVKALQFQIVKTLLTMGAEMDTQDNSGNTALHYAIKENDLKIVKFLVQSGAKMDLKNKNNETPKTLAKKADIELNL